MLAWGLEDYFEVNGIGGRISFWMEKAVLFVCAHSFPNGALMKTFLHLRHMLEEEKAARKSKLFFSGMERSDIVQSGEEYK